jgi:hypothetical protein
MTKRRALVIPLIALVIMTALSAIAPAAYAEGGDFSLDFIAAGPGTYNHTTGVGGEYADRTIDKETGVVESLEGGDFACGDKVVYFTQIVVDPAASGAQDIELDYAFLAETTGQPGAGHSDLLSATRNTGDPGESGNVTDTTVSIVSKNMDTTPPPSKDTLFATVRIQNLDPGETFILRLVTVLDCLPNENPTGNLQADILAGRVIAPVADAMQVGNQTIPFFRLDLLAKASVLDITVGDCPRPGSPTRPVTIKITPADSAVVTILGPGGPYVVDGSGDTLDLAPGDYTWTAVRAPGYFIDGPSSGSFTVATCPKTPVTVSITVGPCPAPGSATRAVTVSISPPGQATVTILGPGGPYVVTGSGQVLNLAPGDYTWSATTDDEHQLTTSSGGFTVGTCPRIPATVTVTVGACPAPGSPTRPVTVTIAPPGSATVTITGPGGPYEVTGSGTTLNLAPGSYHWSAVPDDEHSLSVSSDDFTVTSCPAIAASAVVAVGACPSTSSATRPVSVTISPDGGADVTITGPNAFNEVVTGTGRTLNLSPGDYAWSAAANETFELLGATEGTFKVASCIVQVLPKRFLPSTGASVPGLGGAGAAFVLIGIVLVTISYRERRPAVASGVSAVASRLQGRSVWAAPAPRLVLPFIDRVTRRAPVLGWVRRRGDRTGRAGPGDG